MNQLTDMPLDRNNMFHPSIFQLQENWDQHSASQQNNGRVNLVTQAKINEFLNASGRSCDVVVGRELPTVLSVAFMGPRNTEILQQGLVTGVRQQTGYTIGRQSDQALTIEMETVYNDHARNANEVGMEWEELKAYVVAEIKRLNCIVYTRAIPNIVANIQHYLRYIQEKDKPLPVIANPTYAVQRKSTLGSPLDPDTRVTSSSDALSTGSFAQQVDRSRVLNAAI